MTGDGDKEHTVTPGVVVLVVVLAQVLCTGGYRLWLASRGDHENKIRSLDEQSAILYFLDDCNNIDEIYKEATIKHNY